MNVTPPASRTIVYIDGFNRYYRAVKGTTHKWLDLVALSDHVLGRRHNVVAVRYFTARILDTPKDRSGPQRQQAYLTALDADPRLTIHLGQFRPREKSGRITKPPELARRFATIGTFEEKGSDVNMASWALADAYEGRADTVVLLTNDSDLAEPARILQARNTPVGVIVPAPGLKPNTVPADFIKTLRPSDMARCQLPGVVNLPDGRTMRKPSSW